jgi:DNA primase
MMKLTSEADVNHRLSLIELAKHYHIHGLTLCGSSLYRGVCPFCKSSEFQIMPTHGLWFCFGCHEAGKAFDLVTRLEGVSKEKALERINTWICGESTIGYLVCL